jgi:hypothetical protein
MPTKLKYELTATVGTYIKNGEEKKRYQRCGSVFENEKGHLSVKLDCLPVSNEWSGFFSCFEPKEQGRDRTPQDGYRVQQQGSQRSQPRDNGGGDADGEEIPFAAAENITHW